MRDRDQRQRHDDAGQRVADVGERAPSSWSACPDGGPRARPPGGPARRSRARRRCRGRGDAAVVPVSSTSGNAAEVLLTSQYARHPRGTPSASTASNTSAPAAGTSARPSCWGHGAPGGARADAGDAGVPRRPRLAREEHEAEQDEDAGEHRGPGTVEGRLELVVDRRREGVEAQRLEGAELREEVQAHQQCSAEQCRAAAAGARRARTCATGRRPESAGRSSKAGSMPRSAAATGR